MSEATRIDTLTIDIVSDSKSAVDSIEDLAIALEDIKQTGKISTAVKNLQGLTKAIKDIAAARSPTANLQALKDGMSRIKEVGSITTITNRIDKLVESMRGVHTLDLTGVDEKFDRIARSLRGLSEIKGGGIGTMMNALAKIDKVNAALGAVDENGVDAIDRFAEKVERLTEKLTPLSQKMVTIQAGLKGINTQSRKAGVGVGNFSSKLNATNVNAAAFTTVLQRIQRGLERVKDELVEVMATAIEWDGIASRFGRGFGSNAQETYDWIKRLNKEMNINTQDFMQYSSVYATMLTGYGVAQEDAAKMALGYTELTYDIWAGYNDIYKSFEDAAVAVRSAIAGETEPIQKAGLDVRDSALKQVAALNEVEYSTQGATQAQKSYLRYLALVDQAQDQSLVGAYAAEMNTAEGAIRTLKQQIKSLGQALGSILLPILVEIVPWVQAFVELLTEAVIAIGAIFGVEIQPVDFSSFTGLDGVTSSVIGVEDAAEDATEALKDLKKATIGIDELNVISPPTDNSTSDTSGADWESLDIESFWDESIFEAVNSRVDELKEKLKGILPIIGSIALAFAGWRLLDLLSDMDDVVTKFPKLSKLATGLGKTIATVGITLAVGKLSWDFTGAFLEEGNWTSLGGQLGTTVLGAAVAAWLAGPLGAGIVLVASGVVALSRLGVEVKNGTVEFSDPESIATSFVGVLETLLGGTLVIDKLSGGKIGTAITGAVSTGLNKAFGGTSFGWIITVVGAKIKTALLGIGTWLASGGGWAIAAIAAVVGALVLAIVDYDFTEIGHKIGYKIGEFCRSAADWLSAVGKPILDGLSAALDWCAENITLENILSLFNPLTWSRKIIPWMVEVGVNTVGGILQGMWDGLINLLSNIGEFVTGLYEGFCEGFGIHSPADSMIPIGEYVVAGIWEGFKNFDIFKKIGEWADDVWKTIKSWFGGSKKADEQITVGVELVKQDWSTIKNWIGTISPMNQPISLEKKDWTTVPEWIGTIPTVNVPMKLVKNGWTSVKSWLGNLNFQISFSLPRIGINWGTSYNKGFTITYPSSFYTYAKGGFPDFGELFIAREQGAGPEMVGRIGSKTTVANNDQIVEGISDGVYAAVLAANRQSEPNSGQAVNVYLDSRQITAAVEKRMDERGVSVINRRVYGY